MVRSVRFLFHLLVVVAVAVIGVEALRGLPPAIRDLNPALESHGLNQLVLTERQRALAECVVTQLATDPRWGRDFIVTRVGGSSLSLDLRWWKRATARVDDGTLEVISAKHDLYFQTTECSTSG
jgi:hypothetical protein